MKREEVVCFQYMALRNVGYADADIALEAMSGFPVAGWIPPSQQPAVHLKKGAGGEVSTMEGSVGTVGLPDAKMDEIVEGFPLTGWAEQSGVFMPDASP